MQSILNELYLKLGNHDLDMDGYGQGYEAGLIDAINVVKLAMEDNKV